MLGKLSQEWIAKHKSKEIDFSSFSFSVSGLPIEFSAPRVAKDLYEHYNLLDENLKMGKVIRGAHNFAVFYEIAKRRNIDIIELEPINGLTGLNGVYKVVYRLTDTTYKNREHEKHIYLPQYEESLIRYTVLLIDRALATQAIHVGKTCIMYDNKQWIIHIHSDRNEKLKIATVYPYLKEKE